MPLLQELLRISNSASREIFGVNLRCLEFLYPKSPRVALLQIQALVSACQRLSASMQQGTERRVGRSDCAADDDDVTNALHAGESRRIWRSRPFRFTSHCYLANLEIALQTVKLAGRFFHARLLMWNRSAIRKQNESAKEVADSLCKYAPPVRITGHHFRIYLCYFPDASAITFRTSAKLFQISERLSVEYQGRGIWCFSSRPANRRYFYYPLYLCDVIAGYWLDVTSSLVVIIFCKQSFWWSHWVE